MNPFSFSGMGAVSFGIDRIKQLADDILTLNGSRVPVVLISDAGVSKAGILAQVKSIVERAGHPLTILCDLDGEPHAATVDQTGMSRSLAEKAIDPATLAELMMSAENLPMTANNARPISKSDALELARQILRASGSES